MFNRYAITKGMYNIFDHCITVPNLSETALFYHEYYHHIQNVSTVLGSERLNLLVQFLAHATNLASSHAPLKAPFNRWHEKQILKGFDTPTLKRRLDNLILHQEEWSYLDKIDYDLMYFTEDQCNEFIATVENKEKESLEPYIVQQKGDLFIGYPIGGFTISESGAYALELWHRQDFDPIVLESLNQDNYQYLIVLDMMYRIIEDFRLACLATFLFCDLAMIIATPSMGFLALYQQARFLFSRDITEEKLFKWYAYSYHTNSDLINENINIELKMIADIENKKKGLNQIIDNMFGWQLNIMKRGLKLRVNKQMDFVQKLLSYQQKDLDELIVAFPPTIIETTDDGNIRCSGEDDVTNYEMLNATYHLYLGLCRDVNYIFDKPEIIHTKRIDDKTFMFDLQTEGNNSDAYGYLLHTMGLINKPITILT